MKLFSFIKSLFFKAEQIQEAVETFVEQVEEIVPETKKVTTKAKEGIARVKKETKKAKEIAVENEAAINVAETVIKTVRAKKSTSAKAK